MEENLSVLDCKYREARKYVISSHPQNLTSMNGVIEAFAVFQLAINSIHSTVFDINKSLYFGDRGMLDDFMKQYVDGRLHPDVVELLGIERIVKDSIFTTNKVSI